MPALLKAIPVETFIQELIAGCKTHANNEHDGIRHLVNHPDTAIVEIGAPRSGVECSTFPWDIVRSCETGKLYHNLAYGRFRLTKTGHNATEMCRTFLLQKKTADYVAQNLTANMYSIFDAVLQPDTAPWSAFADEYPTLAPMVAK